MTKNHFHTQHNNTILLTLLVLVGAAFGYLIISLNSNLHSDEVFHANQIWLFFDGQDRLLGNITVPPTYHYIIGRIVQLTGGYHDNLLRLISLSIALSLIPISYWLAKHYHGAAAWEKPLHIFFTPLIFPYFFLLYTDLWSLCCVAMTLLLTLHRRFFLAGFVGGLSLLIRQDNIAWIGLIYLYICFESVNNINRESALRFALNALTKGSTFNLVFIGFIVFVYLNKGIAIGDADSHKISSFNISNLHVFLICCWFLFFPMHLAQLPKIIALLKKPVILALIFVGFFIYAGTLKNPHPYNELLPEYFIHNGLMHLLTQYPLLKACSYLIAIWALMSLITFELPDWRWRAIILLAPVVAACHPLVEPRYYIPAFFLIHLLRKNTHSATEKIMLSIYVMTCSYIIYGITKGDFFL